MRLVQREPRTIVVAFARDADERDKTAADRRNEAAVGGDVRFANALNERSHGVRARTADRGRSKRPS